MAYNSTRSLARRVLGFIVAVCPGETHEWGAAMMAELDYVQGTFAALRWAAGCSVTLLRHSATVLVRRVINKHPAGETLSTDLEGNMRKSTIILILVLTAASSLFVFAPGFRQALQLSGTTWRMLLFDQPGQRAVSPQLLARIEKQARKTHDAQALAFVALHERDPQKSGSLAEQAVEWDAQLTWVYARLANRPLVTPEANRWIRSLQKWDPGNAVPYLLEASLIRRRQEAKNNWRPGKTRLQNLPGWAAAMGKAFSARKLDSYLSDGVGLDRAVLTRSHVSNPFAVLEDATSSYFANVTDIRTYAHAFPMREGQDLEAKGKFYAAEQKYWSVARFGHLIELQGQTDVDQFAAAILELEAYRRLLPLAEKRKDMTEAALLRYEIVRLEENSSVASMGRTGHGVSAELNLRRALSWMTRGMAWEAATVQLSALLVLLSGLVLVLSCLYAFGKRCQMRSQPSYASPTVSTIGIVSATCLFLSSATLYFAYQPYHALFNHFMAGGSARTLLAFGSFLMVPARMALGLSAYTLRVYFWYAVIGTGVIGLLIVVAHHLRHRPSAQVSNVH